MPADPFIGDVSIFAGNFAPRGWAKCDGQLLPIAQYSALFSLLGTMYGGDGRTTFALPDLRGRVAVGEGNGPGLSDVRIGERGGAESVTLQVNNLPPHDHPATMHAETSAGSTNDPTGNLLGIVTTGETKIYAAPVAADEIAMSSDSITVGNTGGGQSIGNMQPYLGMNYIISLQGVFPSRS